MHRVVLALLVLFPAAPAWSDAAVERGIGFFEAGDDVQAEQALRQAVREEKRAAQAHYYLGLTLSRQGRHDEAVEALEEAVRRNPELPGARLSLGVAYFEAGSLKAAVRELSQLVEAEPSNASALLFLGLASQQLGRHREAVSYFERAARDPELEQLATFNAGVSLWESGERAGASDALTRAIAVDPESDTADEARRLLAVVNDPARAKRWFVRASVGAEYDDNVTVSEVDASSGESDVAAVTELGGGFRLIDSPELELETGYDFYQSLYADLDDFNLRSHSLYLDGSRKVREADVGLGYRFTTSTLGGDDFLDVHTVRPHVAYSFSPTWYADIAYDLQRRDFDDSPRDAWRNGIGIQNYLFFSDQRRGYVVLGYELAGEDADASEYDYLGHFLKLALRAPIDALGPEWELRAGYEYWNKNYDSDTPSIGRERSDRRHALRLGLERRLTQIAKARLVYEYMNQDSNLPSADYDQNVIRLDVAFDF